MWKNEHIVTEIVVMMKGWDRKELWALEILERHS
jgi:hypothetical protein